MSNPIIPVEYFTVSGDLVTGFNIYGKSMTGEFKASHEYGYYIQDGDRMLFDVIYVQKIEKTSGFD